MARRPTLLVVLVLALIVSVAVARNSGLWQTPTPPAKAPDPKADQRAAITTGEAANPSREASRPASAAATAGATIPAFDILRIDPTGSSVFAGRSEPEADVAILAAGKEIARTRAGSDGSWSIVTSGSYEGGDVAFRVSAAKDGKTTISDAVTVAVPVTPAPTPPRAGQSPRVAAATPPPPPAVAPRDKVGLPPTKRELERLVDEIRTNPEVANNPAKAPAVIPVPITFETGDTAFTAEGRTAAGLLAEYVKGAGLTEITLSGHADERGPDRYNLKLSRQRLEAIAAYLREHGYSGKLTLLAKGEREPFMGVDRRSTPRTQLWSYDRRVELRTR